MRFFSAIVILSLFLASCASKEKQEAASKAASVIQAGSVKVGVGAGAGIGKGKYKSITLEFSDFSNVPENYPSFKLSSSSAFIFLQNIKEPDYAGYDKIQVTIKRQGTEEEALYDIKRLQQLQSQMDTVQSFLATIKGKSFEGYRSYIDTVSFDKEDQVLIYNAFLQIDSAYGAFSKATFTGFKFIEVEALPQTMLWAQLEYDSVVTRIGLRVNEENKKIVALSINPD